jgi:hypothetical protein
MGGGSPATSTETQTQSGVTDLPAWAKPYFERTLARGETESLKPYEAYTGPRQALSSQYGDIGKAQDLTRTLAGSGIAGLGAAQDYSKYAIDQSKELGNYTPTQASEYQFDPTRQFSGAEVQQYMDPYMQNVVDQQKQQAFSDFSRMNANRAQQGVNAGAFGGSRQGVVQGMAEEGLMGQLGQIQAKGLSDAYGQAVGAFQADRSAQSADQAAKAAEAARVQQMTESGKQFAAGQGISQLLVLVPLALKHLLVMGSLVVKQISRMRSYLKLLVVQTKLEGQQGLDLGYQEYLTKQGFTQNQIANMSNMLQGLPVANAGTSSGTTNSSGVQYQATPGFGQQVLGAGLTGLSLYKAFKDGGLVR